MMVTPLVHDRGARPCHQTAQYATTGWLDLFTRQGTPVQCLACNRIVTMKDLTASAAVNEATLG